MQAVLTRESRPASRDLLAALVVSLLVHLLAFGLLFALRYGNGADAVATPPLLDVDVVSLPPPPAPAPVVKAAPPAPPAPAEPVQEEAAPPPIPVPERQIVSPPDEGKEEAPKNTRYLSDRNNTVKEEMVRKGESEAAAARPPAPAAPGAPARERAAAAKPQQAPRAAAREPGGQQMARAPTLDQLLPSAGRIASEGYAGAPTRSGAAENSQAARPDVMRYADAFNPSGGRRGTMDFLPDVREGDVTLLNTKAELFAPFVRRVAQRVFQSQIITLRRDVPRIGVTTTESAAVEAVMNKQGVLVSVRVTEQSGTSTVSVDRHLQRACQQAFFDLNPPPGAESSDGNIHFVFQTQVQVVATPQGMRNYGAVLMAGLL